MACAADVGCPFLLPPLLYLHKLKPVLSFTLSGKTYTWTTNNIDRRKLIQMLSYVFYLFLVFFQFYDLLHSMYYYIYYFLFCTYIMSPFMWRLHAHAILFISYILFYHIFSYTILYCHILCICVFTLTIELTFTTDSRRNLILFVIQ